VYNGAVFMEISLKAEPLFHIGSLEITNSLFLAFIASFILIIFAVIFRKKINLIPGKLQGAIEVIIEFLLGMMASVLGSKEKAEKFLPLIATIFIFVMISNWLGLLPGVGSFMLKEEHSAFPLLRAPAADLNFTLALAILSVFCANFFGIIALGFFSHIKKFLNFSNPINFFVGILETISEIAKIISFSFRLFGNIFAGEVLLTVMFFLMPYIVPIPFIGMELFVGLIQAFIFAMLTLVFLSAHTTAHQESHN
jgi:F-type H+-transporting ATPase subunit a